MTIDHTMYWGQTQEAKRGASAASINLIQYLADLSVSWWKWMTPADLFEFRMGTSETIFNRSLELTQTQPHTYILLYILLFTCIYPDAYTFIRRYVLIYFCRYVRNLASSFPALFLYAFRLLLNNFVVCSTVRLEERICWKRYFNCLVW